MRTRNIIIVSLAAVIAAIAIGAGGAQAAGVDLFGSKSIKDDTVRSIDVKDGTLQAIDMSDAAKAALKGQNGVDGTNGEAGLSGLVTRHFDYIKDATYPGAGSGGIATIACADGPDDSGKIAIGGGAQFLDVGRNAGTLQNPYVGETHITDSFPGRMDWSTNTPKPGRLDGWIVRLNNTPSVDMRVWVTCVDAPSAS
jgi:hypothetical protein